MKVIIALILLSGLGYYYYINNTNPAEINDPTFAQARIEFTVQNRDLTMVLMGKMANTTDCEKRGQRFWKRVLEKCESCDFIDYQCKQELPARYQKLFENKPTYATYIVAERGDRTERDARMIVWGLSKMESNVFCQYMSKNMKTTYKGKVSCVEGYSQ